MSQCDYSFGHELLTSDSRLTCPNTASPKDACTPHIGTSCDGTTLRAYIHNRWREEEIGPHDTPHP